MGHWSELLLDEAAAQVGVRADEDRADEDRDLLRELLHKAATEIELLSGRTFGHAQQQTSLLDSGGLPFVEVPDAHVGSVDSSPTVWPVPDPVNPHVAIVLQIAKPPYLADRAIPAGQAIWAGGQLVARASRAGAFSPEYMIRWLGNALDPQQRVECLKRAFEPTNRIIVPIIAAVGGGWWFQITRRLL